MKYLPFALCLAAVSAAIVWYRPATVRAILPIVALYLVFKMWKWSQEIWKGTDDDVEASS